MCKKKRGTRTRPPVPFPSVLPPKLATLPKIKMGEEVTNPYTSRTNGWYLSHHHAHVHPPPPLPFQPMSMSMSMSLSLPTKRAHRVPPPLMIRMFLVVVLDSAVGAARGPQVLGQPGQHGALQGVDASGVRAAFGPDGDMCRVRRAGRVGQAEDVVVFWPFR